MTYVLMLNVQRGDDKFAAVILLGLLIANFECDACVMVSEITITLKCDP